MPAFLSPALDLFEDDLDEVLAHANPSLGRIGLDEDTTVLCTYGLEALITASDLDEA